MRDDRPSLPPGDENLAKSTASLAASNKTLEASVGHLPAPAPTPRVAVSDEQRLEVARELWAEFYRGRHIHLDQALTAYERDVKARLGR